METHLNGGHNLSPPLVGIGLTYLPKNCGDGYPASLLCCYSPDKRVGLNKQVGYKHTEINCKLVYPFIRDITVAEWAHFYVKDANCNKT